MCLINNNCRARSPSSPAARAESAPPRCACWPMRARASSSAIINGAERAQAIIAKLPGNGHRAMRIVLEDSATMREAADDVRGAFGRADILVNSAGFTKPVPHGDLEALDDALLDRMLIANVRGPFAMIRAFAPLLRESGDGVVVNVSSIAGFTGLRLEHRLLRRQGRARQHDDRARARARPADPAAVRLAGRGQHRFRRRPRPCPAR